jgi:glutamate carboxypeptidase
VQALRESGRMPAAGVALAVVPDEERGSVRSEGWLSELAAGFDIALVMEPARANGDLVTGRKGGGFWTLEVTGRSAHAGIEPERGASALIQMAHHALALDAIAARIEGASLVLGTLQAGTAPNVVPDSARMTIDARAFTAESLAQLVAAIEASCAATAGRVPGTTSRLKGGVNKAPMPRAEPSLRLYAVAQEAAAELGIAIGECVTGGTSDANSFAGAGLAVLDGLGPVGGAMHTPDEYIESESLVERTALLAEIVARVGNSHREE